MRELGLTAEDLDRVLNKESGLLGVSGVSNDMRDVLGAAAEAGDERARLALDVYCYRLRKYIGAYAAAMGGLDVLVFTAGVGENSAEIRAAACEGLGFLGIELDQAANAKARGIERRDQRRRLPGQGARGADRRGTGHRRRNRGGGEASSGGVPVEPAGPAAMLLSQRRLVECSPKERNRWSSKSC